MAANIKTAIAVGDDVLTYVESGTTVGSNGTGGSYSIKGQRQITDKTAEGTAIKFQVVASEASDIYMGDMGVAVYGVVSVSGPTDGCVLTVFVG